MPVYVGLDIGGTKLMVAAETGGGEIIHRVRADTSDSLTQDLAALHDMIETVAAGQAIAGMGAAIGGPLDWENGIVSPLHQPDWRDVHLKEIMEARWDCPFYVDVDTNVAALGEFYRTKMTAQTFLYITLSTGMGGGILLNGRVYRGKGGVHSEIGHQSIPYRCSNPAGLQCECGAHDCLEALVSGNGIRRIYGKPAERLSLSEWNEVAYNLGQGLRNLAAILAPDEIRLGGGVAVGGGPGFIQSAAQIMMDHLNLVPAPTVGLSQLGYDTALLGAITIAKHGSVYL